MDFAKELTRIIRPFIKKRGPEPTFRSWLSKQETEDLFDELWELLKKVIQDEKERSNRDSINS